MLTLDRSIGPRSFYTVSMETRGTAHSATPHSDHKTPIMSRIPASRASIPKKRVLVPSASGPMPLGTDGRLLHIREVWEHPSGVSRISYSEM